MRKLYLFAFLLHLASLCVSKEVTIGLSLSSDVNDPRFQDKAVKDALLGLMGYQRHGAMVFEHYINEYMDENGPFQIGGEDVEIKIRVMSDDYTEANITANYEAMIEDGIDFFVSGFGSSPSNFAAAVTESKGKLLVSSSTTSRTFQDGKVKSFSVYPTAFSMASAAIPNFRIAGVKSVTFLKAINAPPNLIGSQTICDGFEDEFRKSSIENFTTIYYDYSNTNDTDFVMKNYTDAVKQVASVDNDLLVFCGTAGNILGIMLEKFRDIKYAPRAAYSTTLDFEFEREIINFWVVGSSIPDAAKTPPVGQFIKSEEDYKKRLKIVAPEFNGYDEKEYKSGYFTSVALGTILSAMLAVDSTNVEVVSDAVRRNIFHSFVGDIFYDAQNRILNPGIVYQYTFEALNVLSPHTFSNGTLVYPMTPWDKRVLNTSYSGIEIAVIVFLVLAILNSLAWLVVVIIHRNEKEFVANSPLFLCSMLVGSILIYISIFFWTPTHKSDVGCSIHVAFLLFGFLLLFGSMVVKTWRVHLLFSQKTLKVFHISNSQVALFLGILLSVDVILYLIWALLTKSKLVFEENFFIPYESYYYCSTTTGGKAVIYVMIGYHGLIFLYGAYLALRVRTIPFKIYDESKIIAFCIYNVGVVAIIVAILEGTQAAERYVQFGLRSFLIILSSAVTINTMLVGKFTISKMKHSTSSSHDSSKMQSMNSMNSMSSISDNRYVDLEERNAKLKRENKKLKKEIKELRESLEALKKVEESSN